MLTVLCVDDHPAARAGLVSMIVAERDLAVVAEAGTAREAIALFAALAPDVVLMDLQLPDMDGGEATAAILRIDAHACVILVTAYDDPDRLARAVKAGVAAVVMKERAPSDLVPAVRKGCA